MSTQKASKTLPIILAVLTLITAIFFWKQRDSLRQKTQDLLDRSDKISLKLPEPTPFVTATPMPIVTLEPTTTPTTPVNDTKAKTTSKVSVTKTIKTSTQTICTPVYGMANTCVEHTVVDTGLDTSAFYNLAALSYFGGLIAFIKSKRS